jgi:hypothetical protein
VPLIGCWKKIVASPWNVISAQYRAAQERRAQHPHLAERRKAGFETVYKELDLDDADDAHLLDAMIANPVLINRPIVVTDTACLLCRPAETVNALLG